MRVFTKDTRIHQAVGGMTVAIVALLACVWRGAGAIEGHSCYREPSPYSVRITRGAAFQHRSFKMEGGSPSPFSSSARRMLQEEQGTSPSGSGRRLEEEEEARPHTDKPLHAPVVVGGTQEEDTMEAVVFTDPASSANGTDLIAPRPFVVDGSMGELQNINVTIRCKFQDEDKDAEDEEKCTELFEASLEPEFMHPWVMQETELSTLYSQFQSTIRDSNATVGLLRISRALKSFIDLDWKDEVATLTVSIEGSPIYDDNPDDVITSNEGASRTDFLVPLKFNPTGNQNVSHVSPRRFVYHAVPTITSSIEASAELEVNFALRHESGLDDVTSDGPFLEHWDLISDSNSMVFFKVFLSYLELNDISETRSFHINLTASDGAMFTIPVELRSPGSVDLDVSPSEIVSEVFPGGTIEEFMSMETTGGEGVSQVRFFPASWDFAFELFEGGLESEEPLGSTERIQNLTDTYQLNEIFANWFHMSLPADINQTRFFSGRILYRSQQL
eukprot:gb/GECG01001935.1/.p1 GENE.gb/GECG01001935.1/~~gb/GECG01001935.1/.p1  ORF type:complete len:502 (+),score=67.99 gb/GECG01001935.1/:1-1506(+)